MANQYKRQHFRVLDPAVQKDLYVWLAVIWLGWVACQSAFVVIFKMIDSQTALENKDVMIFTLFFVFSSFLFIFTLLSMSYFVNKFIGPIYRIRVELEKSKNENQKIDFQLRQGDYFQDIVENLNQMEFKKK